MDNPLMLILVLGLVFGSILAYVIFMIFLPEWVGITGKSAKRNQESHQGQTDSPDNFDSNLDKWS